MPGDFLAQLADADVHSVVKQVQEFYGDYYAVNPDLFSLDLGHRWRIACACVCFLCVFWLKWWKWARSVFLRVGAHL